MMPRDEDLEAKVLLKKVDTLFRKNKLGLPGIIVFVMVLLFVYRGYHDQVLLFGWASMVLILAIAQWMFIQKYFSKENIVHPEAWAKKLAIFSFGLALLIGSSVFFFYVSEDLSQTLLIGMFIIGSIFGSVIFAASYFPIHMAWSLPLALPFSVVLLSGTIEQLVLGVMFIFVGIPVALVLGWMMSREYAVSLQLRFEKDALLNSLQAQKEAADKANKDKTHFLAAASHDLRQPHQALGLFVEALDHLETDPKKKDILSKTKQAFKAMSSLLDQLLDISKLDNANIKAEKKAVLLQPLLHQVVMEHMGEAEQKGLELRLRATAEVAYIDAQMVIRMLSNLVTNAIRYTKKGGVLVAVRQRQGKLRLDVWDTGCGIPENQQQNIFKEFTQLENSERDREKGLGLGLAIVDRLAKIMDTNVSLVSKLDKGTRFSVLIEHALESHVEPNMPNMTPVLNAVEALNSLVVVVIDDDTIARESMKTILQVWGCVVHSFPARESCLAHLNAKAYCPDVLIVDYRLRKHDNGIKTVLAIRKHCQKDIPAMVITGDTAKESIEDIQGAQLPILHKPVDPQDLKRFLVQVKSKL